MFLGKQPPLLSYFQGSARTLSKADYLPVAAGITPLLENVGPHPSGLQMMSRHLRWSEARTLAGKPFVF